MNKDDLKLHNRLVVQMYLYFAIILILFSILIGIIFMKLYEKSNEEFYRNQLLAQTEQIGEQMSALVIQGDTEEGMDYMDFLETIQFSESTDIWFLANSEMKNPMKREFTNIDMEDVETIPELKHIIEEVLKGNSSYSSSYDSVYQKVMMRAGYPIHDAGGNICGIVILNSYIEPRDEVVKNSGELILFSVLVSAVIAFFVGMIFAKKLSNPISNMRIVALELAKGNYEKRTNVKRNNEIGVLAHSIDTLAARLEETEEERRNMEQMRMDFFANVSHELRTPITVMRGYSEALVDDVVKEEKKKQYYNRMITECKSMERLVGDLLTLSKMQNPDFIIASEPINLVQVFADLVRSARKIDIEKNIQLHVCSDQECAMIMGDYDRLRQMFLIILDNAIKFSEENKEVHINIKTKDKIVVEIKDKGIGIDKEELPFIFEKFYKSKLRQNAKGSGLGLVIAKQIAIKHDGTITVNSELGKGTEFIFEFPKLEGQEFNFASEVQ